MRKNQPLGNSDNRRKKGAWGNPPKSCLQGYQNHRKPKNQKPKNQDKKKKPKPNPKPNQNKKKTHNPTTTKNNPPTTLPKNHKDPQLDQPQRKPTPDPPLKSTPPYCTPYPCSRSTPQYHTHVSATRPPQPPFRSQPQITLHLTTHSNYRFDLNLAIPSP